MARNEFETEVGKLLERYLPVVHRIPDAAFNRTLGRQTSKKPFDYFGCSDAGEIFAAEAKRVKVNRFSFDGLSPHQHEALDSVEENEGYSWLFLNFRVKAPGHRCGRAFWIPFWMYKDIERDCARGGRKSMNPEHIAEEYELNRIKGGWAAKDIEFFIPN